MATFKQRESGWWQAVIRRKGHPPVSKTFPTKTDAESWAKLTEADMLRGQYMPRQEAERTTIHELIERYRQEELPKLRGKGAGPALNSIDEALGKYALASITSKLVAQYRDRRLKIVAASTVRKEINLLSRLIDLAGKEWGIPLAANPCAMVSKPRENNARERRLDAGEEEGLLDACSSHMALLVRFALETAARLGEILALRWSEVDTKKRVAIIRGLGGRETKNGESFRAVPLSSAALAVLEELKALPRHVDGRVFYWWKAADGFNKSWSRACKRVGIEGLRFHDPRHEATSRLFERGVFDSMEVAAITGHKTLQMLKRYTHLRAEDLAKKLG